MKAKIISIANQKGGVGKTTSCINLSAAMASLRKNHRILIIDSDPQGNASTGFGIKKNNRKKNIYDALTGRLPIEACISPTMIPNLDIITATIDLAAAEFELQKVQSWQYILKNYLTKVAEKYSYIFIDCPPSLGLLTINSLVASNAIVIPLQCEFFALEGLSHLFNTIEKIKMHLNSSLQIEGVLLTMYDKRNRLTRLIETDVRGNIGGVVYQTVIPRNVALPESSSHGQPILVYNESSLGSKAYLDLAREIYTKYNIETDDEIAASMKNLLKANAIASSSIDVFMDNNG